MQLHSFNDLEGLRIAAEMERRGGEFYRHAAKVVKSPETAEVLNRLADDEAVHLCEFTTLYEQVETARNDEDNDMYDDETSAFLSAIASDIVFPGGLMSMAATLESVPSILRHAIQSEKDSIAFYDQMIKTTHAPYAAEVFQTIVVKEREHLCQLELMLIGECS